MYNGMASLPLVLVALMLFGVGCNQDKLARLEKENRDLAAKLAATIQAVNLDAQAKCAQQSRAEFDAQAWPKTSMASFTNHYNQKLNKCFMETVTTPSDLKPYVPTSFRTVADAFEGKVYADYFWRNATNKKYWEVAPTECKVTTLTGETVFCKSTEEYEQLIK
jgi:hypothetical protein